MRMMLAILLYLVSLILVAVATFFVVIVLAGPHAGMLPQWAEAIVLAAGWVTVVALPVLVTRTAWRKWKRQPDPGQG